MLSLTISLDHNVVDGAPATRFTERLKELIESGYGLESLAEPLRSTFDHRVVIGGAARSSIPGKDVGTP
jgi:pyruvate/2-oxoglutarate dehydrogenase complex dihydrolipoamide acyltransferase (E2) component